MKWLVRTFYSEAELEQFLNEFDGSVLTVSTEHTSSEVQTASGFTALQPKIHATIGYEPKTLTEEQA
jgi:hypothetical protein